MTCRRCHRPRPLRPRWRLCRACYASLWRRGQLAAYAPPPLPPAPPLTTRVIPPTVRQLIRALVAQGHTQTAVARHFGISYHTAHDICHEDAL
jgi:DNA invertase Pin-like site-specific DNA recombinase